METHTTKKFIRAKKSLGQNFLKSVLALNKIIEAGEIKKEDNVLEIGPGKGALTQKLLENSDNVIAIEKDKDLIEFLKEKFKKEIEEKKLTLVESDILKYKIIDKKNYKIIANIPYNITGAILEKFLTEENQPELMVLMVQNEVAKRIVANDKKESILSVSVKIYGEPKIIMKVPARYFSPAPNVDSAIIKIMNISRKKFKENSIDEKKFWEIIHNAFAHKRKVLTGNLKSFDKTINWVEILKKINVKEKVRAEDLNLLDWIKLISSI